MNKKELNTSKDKEASLKLAQSDIAVVNIQKQYILVAVRIRPMHEKETVMSNIEIVKTQEGSNGIITIVNPLEYQQTIKGTQYLQSQKNIEITKSKEYQFSFDEIFKVDSSQEDVYNYSSFLLRNALDGFNSTILAYGTTGTGKTYSMVGNGTNPGIMVRTISDIFNIINEKNAKQVTVQLSYVEIYNEVLSDLLSDGTGHTNSAKEGAAIEIRNDPSKGVILVGAIIKNIQTASEAYTLLIKGNKRRREDSTSQNENSSRSHAILQILLEQKSNDQEGSNQSVSLFGKYLLVDLAGSEKVSKQTNESGSINKSLLALTNCINAIINNKAGSFVPWRDSKLTRILKDALNGNSRALMLTTISPSVLSLEETLYTLQFASRAKNVKVKVKRNEVTSSYHISKYDIAIQELQKEIAEMKSQIAEKSFELNNTQPEIQLEGVNNPELEAKYLEMKDHFEDEVQLKRKIIEKEKEAADNKLALAQNKNKVLFQDPKTTAAKVKEIKEMEQRLTMITNEMNDLYTRQSVILQKRKLFQKLIEKIAKDEDGKKESGAYLYSQSFMNAYKYHISLLKHMACEARNYVDMVELRLKDEQIGVLATQLVYRDTAIVQVNKFLNSTSKDTRELNFVSSEEIKLDPCRLPSIKKSTRNISIGQLNGVNPPINHQPSSHRESTGSLTTLKPTMIMNVKSSSVPKKASHSIFNQRAKGTPASKVFRPGDIENTPIRSRKISEMRSNPWKNNRYFPFLEKVKSQSLNNSKNESFSHKEITAAPLVTNTSRLEKEIKKNVKTILSKDIIGRFKNSPYSFNNLDR